MTQLPELEQLREQSRTAEHRVKVNLLYNESFDLSVMSNQTFDYL